MADEAVHGPGRPEAKPSAAIGGGGGGGGAAASAQKTSGGKGMIMGAVVVAAVAVPMGVTVDWGLALFIAGWLALPAVAYMGLKHTLGGLLGGKAGPYAWGWLPEPNRWKPFPWNWLPDPIAWLWGLLEIIFLAPLAAILIVVVVSMMVVLKYLWLHPMCAALREQIPELVRSVSRPLGRLMMKDPRNHSYIPWIAFLSIGTPTLFFWAMRRHSLYGLEFSTLFIYHILRLGPRFKFFAHAHVLVHKSGHDHRGFFKGPLRYMNGIVEWWVTLFYGVVPMNYSVAHMKIHHRWHNDVDDVHTNLDMDRTRFGSFLMYIPRFTLYWIGISPAALLIKRREWAFLRQLLGGMAVYYGITALLWSWSPAFCLLYWVYPHVEANLFLCAISYIWHAFVEESDPGNQYVNSVTILEGHDNIWNEDYHVVHHHAPNCHWSDAPKHFEERKEEYAKVYATIFRDTEEGMLIKWFFENNFDQMAAHFVDLSGKLTHEEKKVLLMKRLRVIVGEAGRDGKRREWAATASIRTFDDER
mmetsp:Transcript_76462/g.231795  ORF Transcript_76462/g.231795 Transcript_76462/m.231795 type:complete len:528 (+) Transcript_76462:56-1639(+)